MLSFTQFLDEAGDTALPFKYEGVRRMFEDDFHKYSFNHQGRKYGVDIFHDEIPHHVADVSFADYTDSPKYGHMLMSKHSGYGSVKVMSTIHNIIKHHIAKHDEIEEVHFSSNPDEPSRIKLYTKYTEKHGGETTIPSRGDVKHRIPAMVYRENVNESFLPLTEAGDFHYPFEAVKMRFGAGYKFSGKDHKYIVFPQEKFENPNNRKLHITFMTDRGNVGKTGEAGADSGKILSTVHHIVSHHISQNPDIHTVVFTSDNKEPSRQKLYDRYVTKLGGHSVPGRHETTHFVPANSYKKVNESDDEPIRIQLGRKPDGKRAQAFMDEYHSDSQEHPFAHTARILHGAVVEASKDGNEVHIHDIRTTSPRSGAGTKALKHLTNLADKHNVKLNLFAKAYSNNSDHINNTERLVKWYEKHGFQHEEPDYDESWGSDMKYYPK